MAALGQPTDQREFLEKLVLTSPYNAWCADCHREPSTHCNVSYGTFICGKCAAIHWKEFDMNQHYVKPIFTEHWDMHQINTIAHPSAGNRAFYDQMLKFGIDRLGLVSKYKTKGAKYYRDRLVMTVMGKPFVEKVLSVEKAKEGSHKNVLGMAI